MGQVGDLPHGAAKRCPMRTFTHTAAGARWFWNIDRLPEMPQVYLVADGFLLKLSDAHVGTQPGLIALRAIAGEFLIERVFSL